jgi:hypothetical protein
LPQVRDGIRAGAADDRAGAAEPLREQIPQIIGAAIARLDVRRS